MQRVPYTLPAQDDDVNWLEGFTDAYQRPVIADLGQQSGRYIRMGQLNQILNTTSGAILKIKQGLDNISEAISGSLGDRIQEVIKDAETAIKTRPISWLKTSTNQNCAGLKNFTGVNDNNFGTSLNAVANLKYCNGLPIQ
ncbi:hypothetical protein, partial [Helicobacter sp. MIT 05-5294]|uniref:hypothetical protein n=1 Tax=Helicobacter sp. MIT 05-5294 TaxID=1548150 RepID=UPI0010FF11F4